MIKEQLGDLRLHVAFALAVDALSWLGGWQAGAGMTLGLAGTGASVIGTGLLAEFVARSGRELAARKSDEDDSTKDANDQQSGESGGVSGALVAAAFLVKLPVFVTCALLAQGLGARGLTFFTSGLLLVYCLLVIWAQARV